jgi:GDSL-like lipase/acylhydrolase family protein
MPQVGRSDREATSDRERLLAMAARVANVGLACGGALALLVFVYFFYWYSVTGQRQFSSPFYVVFYYVLPLTLAGALFAALRLQPVHKINLLMLLVGSCMAVYAMELFLSWRASSFYGRPLPVMTILEDSSDRQADAAALGKAWGMQVDPRSAGEVLDALRPTHPDAVPIITSSNHLFVTQPDGSVTSAIAVDGHEVIPLGTVANRVTVLCNEGGQWVDYQSDRYGFNNPAEVWDSEPVEIAALGDSFTHGYCVPPAQNFVALIRQRHSATLNLGIAGDGPLLMLATLTEYLTSLKPRVVLWFYFEGNDLDNLHTESKSAVLRSYLQDGYTQPSLMRQGDIDRAIVGEIPRLRAEGERLRTQRLNRPLAEKLIVFAKLSTLRQQLGLVGAVEAGATVAVERANMELFRDVMLQARTRVERWGGRLVLVYLPDWDRYAGNTALQAAKRGEVIDTARGLGIPVIDVDPGFLAHGDPLSMFPFRRPGHYNAAGHRVVAKAVLDALPAITGSP